MTDTRKMLEMAAKAMGYESRKFVRDKWTLEVLAILIAYPDSDSVKWNPHTDDGDCLRMIAKLRIDSVWLRDRVRCVEPNDGDEDEQMLSDHNNDPAAALRLCALRVAAQMGEQM